VAVTAQTKLDARKLRADFPIFEREIRGKPLAYLDSAVSAHKPRQVLDKVRTFYETSYANVHRGVYTLSELATAEYEGAREKVAQFINAPAAREVIFTHGATESINLVAYAWGLDNLGPGDVVVVTELEHHSNFVPWQYIAKRTGAAFKAIPLDDLGELKLDSLDELAAAGNVKVVANNLVSNALGTINPVEHLSRWAHEQGAIMVVDAAQAAPHHAVDVQQLDCDFLAFSSHKMCGPTSVGALWGRAELLEAMSPFNLGGHMIRSVKLEETTWGQIPYKFEAGTQPIAEAVGFGSAVAYGPAPERRAGIVSFNLDGVHPHDVAQVLDMDGVAIRAGHHCCQPLMAKLGVAATNRASFYLYTVPEEIDRLVEGLHKAHKLLGP
jgi:cysteine desulfurase / selenocysteine lyase